MKKHNLKNTLENEDYRLTKIAENGNYMNFDFQIRNVRSEDEKFLSFSVTKEYGKRIYRELFDEEVYDSKRFYEKW